MDVGPNRLLAAISRKSRTGGNSKRCRMAIGADSFEAFDPLEVSGLHQASEALEDASIDLSHIPMEGARDVDPLEVEKLRKDMERFTRPKGTVAGREGSGTADDDRLRAILQEITRISKDKSLDETQRIAMIRDVMPPPISPAETEPGMHGETLTARSFGHLNDLLFLDSWEELTRKHRPLKLYRGVPSTDMELLTSLQVVSLIIVHCPIECR